jgi:hypothetical protein
MRAGPDLGAIGAPVATHVIRHASKYEVEK